MGSRDASSSHKKQIRKDSYKPYTKKYEQAYAKSKKEQDNANILKVLDETLVKANEALLDAGRNVIEHKGVSSNGQIVAKMGEYIRMLERINRKTQKLDVHIPQSLITQYVDQGYHPARFTKDVVGSAALSNQYALGKVESFKTLNHLMDEAFEANFAPGTFDFGPDTYDGFEYGDVAKSS